MPKEMHAVSRMLTVEETKMRIKHFSLKTGVGIFPVYESSLPYGEPFLNPDILEILRLTREASPHEPIILTTNGSYLTEEIIVALKQLSPIMLSISLNSADPAIRRKLMGDPHPEVAINAIPLLEKHQIPFSGSVICSPQNPTENIFNTLRYLAQHKATLGRLMLAGYTKYHPKSYWFSTSDYYKMIIEKAVEFRKTVEMPVIFHIGLLAEKSARVTVSGVCRGSEADSAGIKMGDELLEIQGQKVSSRATARFLLERLYMNRIFPISIKLVRGESMIETTISRPSSPLPLYGLEHCFGMYIIDDFSLANMKSLRKVLDRHNCRRVLLFSSPLLADTCHHLLEVYKEEFQDVEIVVRVPEFHFFGGNYMVGDLYTVHDYIEAAKKFLREEKVLPDLILLPSTFTVEWGRDITGQCYKDVERELKIPVDLVPTRRISGA